MKPHDFGRRVAHAHVHTDPLIKIKTIFQLPPKAGELKGMTIYKLRQSQFSTSWAVVIGRSGKVPWRSLTQKQYLTGLKNKYEKDIKKFKEGSSYERDYRQN